MLTKNNNKMTRLSLLLSVVLVACAPTDDTSEVENKASYETTSVAAAANTQATNSHVKRPNILMIVADDLGYSDIGSFGGEIATPALDAMAKESVQLTNFHVLPTCSPTRSVLMSGVDNHQAGLGIMAEIRTPEMEGVSGYSGHLNFDVAALPEVLQAEGYRTYMAGKWHLGLTEETSPFARGFDETFALLPGGSSHWSDMRSLSPKIKTEYRRNGKLVETLPEDFYSTKYYTDSLLGWLERDKQSDEPFYAYLSYSAPHDPLHAPAEFIAKYKGKYDGGWDQLRASRFERLKELGIVGDDVTPFPRLPHVKPWNALSATEKKEAARNMEVYAAMVDYIDVQIKRVIDHLKLNGQYENTMVMFFSDNGANGVDGRIYPGMTDEYMASFDNSLDNRGLRNSNIFVGAGWAQASMAPSRLMKGMPAEGGIKSPLLVKLPGDSSNEGSMNHSFFHVRDIMPTLLDIADVEHKTQFKGRTVKAMQGQSVLDLFNGEVSKPYAGASKVGYEFLGFKAYFDGDWKILNLPKPMGKGDWELFNIHKDPAELNDLSEQHPEKRQMLIDQYEQYKIENGVIDFSLPKRTMQKK